MVTIRKLFVIMLLILIAIISLTVQAQDNSGQSTESQPNNLPLELEPEEQVFQFPSAAGKVVPAGSQYLVMHFPDSKLLGIFDIRNQKLIYTLPAAKDVLFGGSRESLVVASPSKGEIARYDLASGKLQLSQKLTLSGLPTELALGSASAGPVVLVVNDHEKPLVCIDLFSLKPIDLKIHIADDFTPSEFHLRAAPVGHTFTGWERTGLHWFYLSESDLRGYYRSTNSSIVIPDQHGQTLYYDHGHWSPGKGDLEGFWLNNKNDSPPFDHSYSYHTLMPAIHGGFTMGISIVNPKQRSKEKVKCRLEFILPDGKTPVATQTVFSLVGDGVFWNESRILIYEKCLWYVPAADVVAVLSAKRDELYLYRLNLYEKLASTDKDYFFVSSLPPATARVGTTLKYPLSVWSSKRGLTYQLLSSLPGMSISTEGVFSWSPPSTGGIADVSIAISDSSGKTIHHTFKLAITSSLGELVSSKILLPTSMPAVDVAKSNYPERKIQETVLFPARAQESTIGGGGRFLVLHFPNLHRLGIIDLKSQRIERYIPIEDGPLLLAAGADKLFVLNVKKQTLSRYGLASGEHELTVSVSTPYRALAIGSAAHGPLYGLEARDSFGIVHALDVDLLKPTVRSRSFHCSEHKVPWLKVSANNNLLLTEEHSLVLENDQLNLHEYRQVSYGSPPDNTSADGTVLYSGSSRWTPQMTQPQRLRVVDINKPDDFAWNLRYTMHPAIDGDFYVTLQSYEEKDQPLRIDLHLHDQGKKEHLLKLVNNILDPKYVGPLSEKMLLNGLFVTTSWERVLYLSSNQLVIIPFDLQAELSSKKIDFLYVDAIPPVPAVRGKNFEYPLRLHSKNGSLLFELMQSPAEMKINEKGVITWNVPETQAQMSNPVLIKVTDKAGQTITHHLLVTVINARK